MSEETQTPEPHPTLEAPEEVQLPKPEGFATKREKQLVSLLTTQRHLCVTGMARRWAGHKLAATYHPTNIDDVANIIQAMEGYTFLTMDVMRGWCKIWDKIADHWPKIVELHDLDDRKGLKAFLKELSDPYLTNPITGNYASSIYG